jgi:hypothetical protein
MVLGLELMCRFLIGMCVFAPGTGVVIDVSEQENNHPKPKPGETK